MPNAIPAKVFISYSHDSEEHKAWVREFAARLRAGGIDVVLDQFHMRLGSDITLFMERNLASCERVLVVCTEAYVEKAHSLKGGVGYERMIVTAEIANDLESNKFIPVLRGGTGEMLPSYLRNKKYIDFRSDERADDRYQELIRELHNDPPYPEPPLGPMPSRLAGQASAGAGVAIRLPGPDDNRYHWHRVVHEHCGNSLFFVFIRFKKDSIFLDQSIGPLIDECKITDYLIFHLYSRWDVLIRVWCEPEVFVNFKRKLSVKPELHANKEFLTVTRLDHLGSNYRQADAALYREVTQVPLAELDNAQRLGPKSAYHQKLLDKGMRLEEAALFDKNRIQFYITIKSNEALSDALLAGLRSFVEMRAYVENKSIYRTEGSATRVMIKGQIETQDYYNAYSFLQEIASHLQDAEVETETMFVAQREPKGLALIDIGRAKSTIARRDLYRRFPATHDLEFGEQRDLEREYVSIWDLLPHDAYGVFHSLFEARFDLSPQKMATQISYFAVLERLYRNLLPDVIMKYYQTNEWQDVLDRIKVEEGVTQANYKAMTLGDLSKIYKNMIIERSIIDIHPLAQDEFSRLMNEYVPKMRNDLGHRPDVAQWNALFSFWTRFILIYARLRDLLEGYGRD